MIPNNIIESFYNRIKQKLDSGVDKNHPTIQREIDRLLKIDKEIPEKIKELFEKSC